jgi:HlyD family secretion protein
VKPSHSIESLTRKQGEHPPPRRFPAWLIPAAITAGFALLFIALFRDRLMPAPDVEVAVVLATTREASAPGISNKTFATGAMLFQASGWIEPDPLPVKATALVDGVVETVHVLEGQTVGKDEPLATLIGIDATLALEFARNDHGRLESTRAAHVASIQSARMRLEAAEAQVSSAVTLRDEAVDRLERVRNLSEQVVPASELVAARLKLERENAALREMEAGREELVAEIARLEIETAVRDGEIAAAAIAVRQAELVLSRTRITAPIAGRVMRLLAAPGQKKMLQDNDPESSTIAILYDPAKLQVRVDVPLADAAGLQIGQAVRLRCSLLPDKNFTGEVTRINGEADLQRNTLQAKVRILDPVDQLRPEMLCRAEFLTTSGTGSAGTDSGQLKVWVPGRSLIDGAVWVCDPETKRVSKRMVTVTPETTGGHVHIQEGVRPGEWVVISPTGLSEGRRVNPQETLSSND